MCPEGRLLLDVVVGHSTNLTMPAPGLDLHKPSDASLLLLLGAPGIQVLRLRTDAARSRDAAVSVVVNMRRKRRW